ncbi:MAG: hypothetical protein ACM3Q1_11975 [Bacteroidales bacterium]
MLLDLVIVADRHCPTSRAYLTYLARANHRVRGVLLVDFFYGDAKFAKLRQRFGNRLGGWASRWLCEAPRPHFDADFRRLSDRIQQVFPEPVDFFGPFDFGAIAERVETLAVANYDDPALHAALRRQPVRTFLYTNGGRVPASLLAQPDIKILHIHPGVVPQVRGSDGLFWSTLVRGQPGASCFYMDAGIDTGALLATRDFPLPRFEGLAGELEVNQDRLVQAILHSYDPHLRAALLLDVVNRHGPRLGHATAEPQDPAAGLAYTWMDSRLKRRALQHMMA